MAAVLALQQSEKFYPGRASDMTTVGMGVLLLLVLVFVVTLSYVAWKAWRDPPIGR